MKKSELLVVFPPQIGKSRFQIITMAISIFLLVSCTSQRGSDEIPTVDLTQSYPEIELDIHDLVDVEYIKLSNDEGFMTPVIPFHITDNYYLTRTKSGHDDILLFKRNGEAVKCFNRKGQGEGEYVWLSGLNLDEKRKEIFVQDQQKMHVYDFEGNFLRDFNLGYAWHVRTWDDDSFITYQTSFFGAVLEEPAYFSIISKEDGKELKRIEVSHAIDRQENLRVSYTVTDGSVFSSMYGHNPLQRVKNGYILSELSSDTIYHIGREGRLSPIMARKPSIANMDDKPYYVVAGLESERYLFMIRIGVEPKSEDLFNEYDLVYDKLEKKFYHYTIKDPDFPGKTIQLAGGFLRGDMPECSFALRYTADSLVDKLEEGQLSGSLKEITETLTEDDNQVIILYKVKN